MGSEMCIRDRSCSEYEYGAIKGAARAINIKKINTNPPIIAGLFLLSLYKASFHSDGLLFIRMNLLTLDLAKAKLNLKAN